MAENYGTLEGTLDEHGMLSGEIEERATLEGEIQFGSGGGGILDVFQNGQSVVRDRYAYVTVPTFLRELRSDDYHNTVTSLEMQIWNGKADPSDIPTKLSELDNDDNYVQDADYVHTDNNFTDEDKAAIGNIPENITDLSDVAVDNIQNGQVLKWDATQEKFVNADESGGGGDVTDVKVNGTSVVDPTTKEANIDLSGYAKTTDIHNPTITIQKNGQNVDTFTLNQTTDKVIDISVPTKTSDLQNDSSFITNTVNNLANYYLKSQTYTQVEVDALIDAAVNGRFQKVNVLPATGEPNIIYLVPKATPETSNACDEYIWQDNAWELIGSTDIDLSGYVTDDELSTALADYLTTSAFNTAIANYYNKTEIGNLLDDKVDKETGKGLSTNDYDNTAKGIVDGVTAALADKVDKVTGKGLSTNDYTTTEKNKVATIDNKADKVTNATNGNLAGLNGSGNLTDSGWNGAKDTTSISGNPISISGLKANQLAVNPIITLEPIQAGSGTPSPSNIRAISGYDKIEVLSCGVNLIFGYEKGGIDSNTGADNTNVNACRTGYIRVSPNTSYYFIRDNSFGGRMYPSEYDSGKKYLRDLSNFDAETRTITTSDDCHYIRIAFFLNNSGWGTNLPNRKDGFNYPATETSYVASNKTTDLSESLGQTVYGATWYPRTGKLRVTHKMVDMGDYTWVYRGSSDGVNYFNAPFADMLATAGEHSFICECYNSVIQRGTNYTISRYNIYDTSAVIYVNDNRYSGDATGAAALKAALSGVKLVYELATPTEIQLTPHEISLLKDYAYVSTNGTNIALDYHNGELASLADVSQLGETVNELGKYSNLKDISSEFTINTTSGSGGAQLLYDSKANIVFINAYFNATTSVAYTYVIGTINEKYRPSNTVQIHGGIYINASDAIKFGNFNMYANGSLLNANSSWKNVHVYGWYTVQ